jgi:hypothetical protein
VETMRLPKLSRGLRDFCLFNFLNRCYQQIGYFSRGTSVTCRIDRKL